MRTGVGPIPARVMLVGEAFGAEEERTGEPFMGASGQELNRMLHEAGLLRSDTFVTNLVNARPPNNDLTQWIPEKKKDVTSIHVPLRDKMVLPVVKVGYQNLIREIKAVQPNVIIAAGNAALWALTGERGVLKWRGSLLQIEQPIDLFDQFDPALLPKIIPIIHPAAILRQWELRAITMRDLARVKENMNSRVIDVPAWNFILQPSFQQVMDTFDMLEARIAAGPTLLALDLETRAGHITCCGLAWSRLDALCIPFMQTGLNNDYWNEDQETHIIYRMYKFLCHPNCKVTWQNGLYDAQYCYRHWHFVPHGTHDTMIAHHVAFAGQPKSLDYQASMYCDYYRYWKDMYKTSTSKDGE